MGANVMFGSPHEAVVNGFPETHPRSEHISKNARLMLGSTPTKPEHNICLMF